MKKIASEDPLALHSKPDISAGSQQIFWSGNSSESGPKEILDHGLPAIRIDGTAAGLLCFSGLGNPKFIHLIISSERLP
jgi:hypothetical protein